MARLEKLRLREKHRLHWDGLVIWLGFFVAFLVLNGCVFGCLSTGHPWLAGLSILLLAHVMHAHLIAFHEAAHSNLCPNPVLNDIVGCIVGLFSFMSLSLYRAAHHYHHVNLATERDVELWPFVIPGTPRWLRCLAAAGELALGLVYTPLLFLRVLVLKPALIPKPALRRRIWAELAFIAAVWSTVCVAAACWHAWYWVLWLYLVPALLAGSMQSFRKYVEHIGLAGSSALSATRSVVTRGWLAQLLSMSLFNEPYHGVHHRYAHLPHTVMPEFAGLLIPEEPGELPPYATYRSAIWDMVRSLPDPRVGAQWKAWSERQRPGAFDSVDRSEPIKHERALAGEAMPAR